MPDDFNKKSLESETDFLIRREASVVDNLPYIDLDIDSELKIKVQNLVDLEQSSMPQKDYINHLRDFNINLDTSLFLRDELTRISEKRKIAPLDQSRYKLNFPSKSEELDLSSWRTCVNNIQARLEELDKQSLDLELLKRFGPSLWRLQAAQLEAEEAALKSEHRLVEAEIIALNRKRKTEQEDARVVLSRLEEKWWQLVRKNNEIETACKVLEIRAKRLKSGDLRDLKSG